jgi:mRNA capping enzyme/mRNA capping enzyme, catalytic domain/RNA cap guanine-N2 methyltransferase
MDLTAEQSTKIQGFITEWLKNEELELETTFGVGGVVDSNTFLQIAQRLNTKGFKSIPQDDRLSIITPKHIRISLQGLNVIQDYCKNDTLYDKNYTAMIKDRAFQNSNIDINEYNIRFKMRREEELGLADPRVRDLVADWPTKQKAFRLIRRWSFAGKGVRIDLSMVRQTPTLPNGGYQWTTTFLQKNILQEIPRYEVEVELLHGTEFTDKSSALKSLIIGVGEVQRAIQKNSLLIRNSVINRIRSEYAALTGDSKFRGVGPVTLQLSNMTQNMEPSIPNIRTGYNVTDKADGLRTMGYVDSTGELFLVDQSMNIYRTGLQNPACAKSIVDGEWVTMSITGTSINHYLIFDIYYYEGKKVSQLPFITIADGKITDAMCRYTALKEWHTQWIADIKVVAKGINALNRLVVAMKRFEFASANNTSIFACCSAMLDAPTEYHTDGLIITSNTEAIPDKSGVRFPQQFKWKPSKDNTVDFLIQYERDDVDPSLDKVTTTLHPDSDQTVSYKTMRLYVGGQKGIEHANPRAVILFEEQIQKEDTAPRYKPILFNPLEFPDTLSNSCNVLVVSDPESGEEYASTEDSKEPIPNRSIVEMRYDPSRESGWRWVPARIRHDKTERLLRASAKPGAIKYSGTMNDEAVANSVWNSIHEPITDSMIRNGTELPTEEEIKALIQSRESDVTKKYYERKAPKENIALVKGLLDFHNKYIKNELLLTTTLRGGKKRLIDFACGKAGDLNKWVYNNAAYVIGVDTAGDNITNPIDGAYRRYLQTIMERGKQRTTKVAFAIGNSSKRIIDGSAGATMEEANILRSIFGRNSPEGPIPPYIQNVMVNSFREGADIGACMFALHYFFEDKNTLDGFLTNLADTIKIGGLFVGCCFDGQRVFNLLRNTDMGHSKIGMQDDVPIWKIMKDYENPDLTADDTSIGLGIDVEFISIGSTHKEYLVPFELLKVKMASIGFRLLNRGELSELGLLHSTNTFDVSYEMAMKRNKKYVMDDTVKDFSFLNRWFIFKRDGEKDVKIVDEEKEVQEQAPGMRFGKEITDKYPRYAKFTVVPSSEYSVLKPWQEPQVTKILQEWFSTSDITRIVDATAHIGVDSIHLSDTFPLAQVDSYEIVPMIYNALVKNVKAFNKEGIIHPHLGDITTWTPNKSYNLLYVDPPWGGVNYKKVKKLQLYLQAEGTPPNESKNINTLVDKWMESSKVQHIILKAPSNFDDAYLRKYQIKKSPVYNQAGRLAYNLVLFTSSTFIANTDMAEAEAEAEVEAEVKLPEEPKEADEDEGEDADADADAEEMPKIELEEKMPELTQERIFRFGAKMTEPVTYMDDKEVTDNHAAKYIAPSGQFPIPDMDDPSIMYPSIEHYLAGTKLKVASTRPKVASKLTTVGDLHQDALKDLNELPFESPKYFSIIDKGTKKIQKLFQPDTMAKYKFTIDDTIWNGPTPAKYKDDKEYEPVYKDFILRHALAYRYARDKRFQLITNALKENNKYLVYTIMPDIKNKNEFANATPLATEFSGYFKDGMIVGENKVGDYMMRIANF